MRQRPVTKSIIMGLDMPFTMEEYLQVEQVRSTFRSLVNLKYENFFANEREGLNHLAQVSYFGGVIQYDFWKKFIDASDLFSQEVMLNLEADLLSSDTMPWQLIHSWNLSIQMRLTLHCASVCLFYMTRGSPLTIQ